MSIKGFVYTLPLIAIKNLSNAVLGFFYVLLFFNSSCYYLNYLKMDASSTLSGNPCKAGILIYHLSPSVLGTSLIIYASVII